MKQANALVGGLSAEEWLGDAVKCPKCLTSTRLVISGGRATAGVVDVHARVVFCASCGKIEDDVAGTGGDN